MKDSAVERTSDFKNFKDLTSEQRNKVYENLKANFPELITTASNFRDTLEFLSEEQRNTLFESLKEKLPELIKTLPDFLFIFSRLSKEQHTKLVDGPLKENRSEFVRATLNINDVLEFLSKEQYQFFKTQFSLNAVHTKCEQLNKGFTRLFFKDISLQKQIILSEVFELAKTIIYNKDTYENKSVQFDKIKNIVENSQAILKTHRGFFKLHSTTSNQITDGLVNHLEYLIAINK